MLSCDCNLEDGPTLYRDAWPIARKAHKCCECGKTIIPGQQYHAECGIWEGEFSSFKTCFECAGVRQSLESIGFCICIGELKEGYLEYLNNYSSGPMPLNHLTSG